MIKSFSSSVLNAEGFAMRHIGNKNFYIDQQSMRKNPIGDFDLVARYIIAILYKADKNLDRSEVEDVCLALEHCIISNHMMLSELCALLLVKHINKKF